MKFVFDSTKVARPSFDPLVDPATSCSSPIFRTHPHGYNFFVKLYPYGIGPATGKCASFLFTLFPGDYYNLFQWPFSKLIHIGIRDQLNTSTKKFGLTDIRPTRNPLSQQKQEFRQSSSITLFLTLNSSDTEGLLIDGASFMEIRFSEIPVLKPHTQTCLLFPFPYSPSIIFTSLPAG